MEKIIIEYYDRKNNYHGIGSFVQINDLPIKKGDKFIVPAASLLNGKSTSNRSNWVGCSEGRKNHMAYLKPLLLTCTGNSETHIMSDDYGAYRNDLCYMELE